MNSGYKLKGGHTVQERQLFLRTFHVVGSEKTYTSTNFVDRGKVYFIDREAGKPVRCNFGASFLTSKYEHTFQPLEEYYEGEVAENE
jgi:hypothetical protein